MNSDLRNMNALDWTSELPPAHSERPAAIRVLVVDDSRASADALSEYLKAGGASVRTVYHGSDALREAKEWLPDCIVLDVAMPGLSGIGVAVALRRIKTTERISLLAFTAFDTADYLQEMKAAGFDAVCVKPMDLSRLEEIIFGLVGRESAHGVQPSAE
jgi:two-component system OmpR family response regulator